MMRILRLLLVPLISVGCAKGIDPPAPTSLVFVSEQNRMFHFGTDKICTDKQEKTSCDPALLTYPTVRLLLDPFAIDEHEVTNLQYLHCVEKGSCTEPEFGNAQGIDKYYDDDPDHKYKNFPVVNVTWSQAKDYCEFVNKRLPTEFEWELAAKGNSGSSAKEANAPEVVYPWGTKGVSGCEGKNISISACNAQFGLPQAVKTMDDDVAIIADEAIYDLAGNVAEWVSDVYDEDITCRKDACEKAVNCAEVKDTECAPCKACADGDDSCHFQCDAGAEQLVCLSYEDNMKKPVNPALVNDRRAQGGERAIRGAHYLTSDVCEARVTDRHPVRKKLAASESKSYLGFRCACDSDSCPSL